MAKKFLSAVLCAALLVSPASTAVLSVSAETAADYGLAEKTSDGVILHAFDWSFNTIKENLPAIAEAGYTSVQTSPVQAPKDYGESWNDTASQWWKLYQPLSFSVATKNSWVGTKDELTELCTEADKYGIKIICDIVSNHMASGSKANSISEDVEEYEPEIYSNYEKYFHQYSKSVASDSNIQNIVQGKLSQLPDLNTGDEYVQERVIALLEECIDCGVDGFRFDAAKHIETADDGEFGSNFWPNVITTATSYAESKGVDLYCYGEILNTPGTERNLESYTQYIDVTDNKTGDTTLAQVVTKNAEKVVKAQSYEYNNKNGSPSDYVLWAESHDTYMGESGSGGIANTASISNEDIAKTWAIVASRSDSKALYFARPGVLMDQMGDTAWMSTAVSEVNKFHNKFIGISDEVYNDGDVVAVQRGDSGIVLVNLGDTADVNVTTKGMKDGTYTDAISGNTFTVKSGKLSGTIGSTEIAVIYEGAATTPKANFSVVNNTSFRTNTMNLTITLENATSGTYSINGAEPVTFENSASVKIGEDITSGDITVKVTATDGSKTVETTQTYTKIDVEHTGLFVYFNKAGNQYTRLWQNAYIYAFYEEKDSSGKIINTTTNGSWPGVPMDYDEEEGLYYYELPKGLNIGEAKVIFTDGQGNQTGDGMLLTSNNMIYDNDKFYDRYNPPVKVTELIYGDIDQNGSIDSGDALAILRASVNLDDLTAAQEAQADVDGDKKITSADSLYTLRHSVKLTDAASKAGTTFQFTEDISDDNKKSENTFYLVNKAGWIFDYGAKLWLVNNKTGEAIETNKESPLDDSSKYAYIDLPEGWKDISVYRTNYDVPEITDTTTIHNKWNCGEIPDDCNAVSLKDGGSSTFTTYTPE